MADFGVGRSIGEIAIRALYRDHRDSQYVPVSTVASPVRQTAEVDVKTASSELARCPLAVAMGKDTASRRHG